MDLLAELLREHSRAQCDRIVAWIGNRQDRFDLLLAHFTSGEYRVAQRAAWPLSYCVRACPELVAGRMEKLLPLIPDPTLHPAIRRNILRLLQDVDIPENCQGTVMDLCFGFITDPQEKPAVKAFSLTVLHKLARLYPDIRSEIVFVIRENWEHESPAFRSRARKILGKAG